MKRLLHVMFSTNRTDYLKRTFAANKKYLTYPSNIVVTKLFIDDYPEGRDNEAINLLAAEEGEFDLSVLHTENLGITGTWNELFKVLKNIPVNPNPNSILVSKFDYILHQEDDVELLQPFNVGDMIELLESDELLSQVQLKRNVWYEHENQETYHPKNKHCTQFKNYFYDRYSPWFWMMFSMYPGWVAEIDYKAETGRNPSESSIAQVMESMNKHTGMLMNHDGSNIINHFGETAKGRRCESWEPDWKRFSLYDPKKIYCSKTGKYIADV